MNAIKNFLTGLAVVGAVLYVLGAVIVGVWWIGSAPGGWATFWDTGWWPWIFLLGWPIAALAAVGVWLHWVGKGFREDVMK